MENTSMDFQKMIPEKVEEKEHSFRNKHICIYTG